MPLKDEFRAGQPASCRSATRSANNLQGRQRRHPHRRADRGDRRGRLGQELADQRGVPAPASRRDRDRPVGGRRVQRARTRPPTPASWTTSARRSPTANKVDAGLFSFNSKGACENCKGLGVIYTDLAFLDGVKTPCEICERQALQGRSAGVQAQRQVHQRCAGDDRRRRRSSSSTQTEIVRKLQAMSDVGLDYLTLGQPLSTLSGGECQRIKLASELHKKGSIYVMDEPTTGLHMSRHQPPARRSSTAWSTRGNTVIVIEHNLDVIRNADWIIDLGPEGGSKGGEVVFEGTPRDLLKAKQSLTSGCPCAGRNRRPPERPGRGASMQVEVNRPVSDSTSTTLGGWLRRMTSP